MLDGKQFFGNGADMLFVLAVYLVAPFTGAPIEILPIGKLASSQEVSLYEAERPFYAAFAIRIADLMSMKLSGPVPRKTTT